MIGSHESEVEGWTFTEVDRAQFNKATILPWYEPCGNGKDWFGSGFSSKIGSIKTVLNGCGWSVLDFGNCYTGGRVEVYLNERKIDHAWGNIPSKIIEFSFKDGDVLEIREPVAAIMKFNKFYTLKCGCQKQKEHTGMK